MKELVDKEKLKLRLHRWGDEALLCDEEHTELDGIVKSCTLSPAALAEEAEENERKAKAWNSLYGLKSKKPIRVETLKEIMETILALAQSEEESDEENLGD